VAIAPAGYLPTAPTPRGGTRPAKALKIEAWADELVRTFDILPVDTSIFRLWARFMHGKADKYYEDAMIAATSTIHGLIVVTRNTRDFEVFGVETLNPFEYNLSP
jgi:predicted nucleic acid-binding protein